MSEQPLATQEYVGNPANFRAPLPYEEAKAPTRIEVQDVSEPVEPNAEPEAVAPAPSPAESLPEVEQPPEILELREQLDRQNQDQERRHQEVLARLDSLTQQIQALVEHLAPPPPGEEEPPPPEDPAAEVLTARPTLEQALNDATNRLAKVKNRLEGRMLFPVRFDREKADNQEYEQARQEYDQALAALIANHRQEHGINNMPENEISSNLSRLVIESDLKLAEAQQSINEQNMQEALAAGGVKGKFREFVHWWAKLPTWKKIGLGGLVGTAVAVGSGGVGAGIFGLAALSGSKFSIGLLNKEASAINMAEKAYQRKVDKLRAELEENGDGILLGTGPNAFTEGWLKKRNEETIDKEKFRRKLRNTIFGVGAVAVPGSLFGMSAAGLDVIPNFRPWEWGSDAKGATTSQPEIPEPQPEEVKLRLDTVDTTSEGDALNPPGTGRPEDFTEGALHLLERNGYKIEGDTPEKIRSITQHMMNNHWKLVQGMEAAPGGGLQQHIVDIGQEWSGGRVGNYLASGEIGFQSEDQLRQFMALAQSEGVKITR